MYYKNLLLLLTVGISLSCKKTVFNGDKAQVKELRPEELFVEELIVVKVPTSVFGGTKGTKNITDPGATVITALKGTAKVNLLFINKGTVKELGSFLLSAKERTYLSSTPVENPEKNDNCIDTSFSLTSFFGAEQEFFDLKIPLPCHVTTSIAGIRKGLNTLYFIGSPDKVTKAYHWRRKNFKTKIQSNNITPWIKASEKFDVGYIIIKIE